MRSINLQMDGNQVCATWDNFDCLATSPAGFGDTIWQAFGRLIDNTPAIEINAIVTSIENAPQNTKELAATDSQQPQPKIITPHCGEGGGCVFPERVNCVGCEYSL